MPKEPLNLPKADILVIDDTPENLNLLSAMLTEQGYKVRSVTKGSTGLRGANAVPPDLILLDVNMPEMNGYQVCQHLKANDRTREIPVIFISALGDVLDKVKAFAVGGVDYITKPFQLEEVLARIENHLTIWKLQQQLQAQNERLQQEISISEASRRARAKAEEKFAKVFRSSPNPIAIATISEARFIDVNPSFLKMSGYSLEEVIGHTVTELNLGKDAVAMSDDKPFSTRGCTSLRDAPRTTTLSDHANGFGNDAQRLANAKTATPSPRSVYAQTIQLLSDTGPLYNQEFEFSTKSGEVKTILLSMEVIDLDGEQCALLIANDITERKRLENEFISLVSHELRTPLTSTMGALDLLGAGQLGTLTEQGQKVLSIATINTERLIRLINDILDLERMKSVKIFMQKVKCNAADLLIMATETMQAMADKLQVKLIVHPLAIELWADPDRLLQTLTNLISNAIKFSEPGDTVWVSATLAEHKDVELAENDHASTQSTLLPGFLLITIQDEGRGIPKDKLQIIFERFQQVDASDSRNKGGTGLGLAICRNIVHQHNGKIWVESILGEGSTFYVLLPLAAF
ncbi:MULTISPECIES: ATP-binding protein [unclassified Nostoc]|uniref:ATP-binding protein n=1 Tax=unclassified Nostoc TaxID=2593658 RepID=UPI002AD3373C|nr:ATP-binding protein [Nostoc sp. DedQUE03]MDZ7974272.1 ATP-binding protein [Nostoc sp. DedQUE03]MDZ8043567.1 ATP-binding protein [Nostoc sp. DedQUE02]